MDRTTPAWPAGPGWRRRPLSRRTGQRGRGQPRTQGGGAGMTGYYSTEGGNGKGAATSVPRLGFMWKSKPGHGEQSTCDLGGGGNNVFSDPPARRAGLRRSPRAPRPASPEGKACHKPAAPRPAESVRENAVQRCARPRARARGNFARFRGKMPSLEPARPRRATDPSYCKNAPRLKRRNKSFYSRLPCAEPFRPATRPHLSDLPLPPRTRVFRRRPFRLNSTQI